MAATNQKNGWTGRTEGHVLRRSEYPPAHFYDESTRGDPLCAAWDEPGYEDPDLSSGTLTLGTRYWQGFAKSSTARAQDQERAMSPGWVARVTEPGSAEMHPEEESDPQHFRVVRDKETGRISRLHSWFMPG